MKFSVITLFPRMIETYLEEGVVGTARAHGVFEVQTVNPRDFVTDNHRTVDDRPFGGGDGMVLLASPLAQALQSVLGDKPEPAQGLLGASPLKTKTIYLSPHGRVFNQAVARELLQWDHLILVSGRYGGVDQRFIAAHVDEEISLGDFVLSGGELAACAVIDTCARMIPGVLGNEQSSQAESFSGSSGWLEAPQFTRPREMTEGWVPAALLSGNHSQIAEWRESISLLLTLFRRPDLIEKSQVSPHLADRVRKVYEEMPVEERVLLGLPRDTEVPL